jgi:hypothetical protein
MPRLRVAPEGFVTAPTAAPPVNGNNAGRLASEADRTNMCKYLKYIELSPS